MRFIFACLADFTQKMESSTTQFSGWQFNLMAHSRKISGSGFGFSNVVRCEDYFKIFSYFLLLEAKAPMILGTASKRYTTKRLLYKGYKSCHASPRTIVLKVSTPQVSGLRFDISCNQAGMDSPFIGKQVPLKKRCSSSALRHFSKMTVSSAQVMTYVWLCLLQISYMVPSRRSNLSDRWASYMQDFQAYI